MPTSAHFVNVSNSPKNYLIRELLRRGDVGIAPYVFDFRVYQHTVSRTFVRLIFV